MRTVGKIGQGSNRSPFHQPRGAGDDTICPALVGAKFGRLRRAYDNFRLIVIYLRWRALRPRFVDKGCWVIIVRRFCLACRAIMPDASQSLSRDAYQEAEPERA